MSWKDLFVNLPQSKLREDVCLWPLYHREWNLNVKVHAEGPSNLGVALWPLGVFG